MLFKAIVFGCVGVTMEVLFTALMDYPRSKSVRLKGYSYAWMLPIYAMVPLFLDVIYSPLSTALGPWRIVIYVAILLAMEYITGWLLKAATGTCPWEAEYRGKRWAVHGLMRLDYAPAWALAALVFEKIYVVLLGLP